MSKKNDHAWAYVALAHFKQGGYVYGHGDSREEALANVADAARRECGFRGDLIVRLYETNGEVLSYDTTEAVFGEDGRDVSDEGEVVRIAA